MPQEPLEIVTRPPYTVEVNVVIRYRSSHDDYYNGSTVASATLTTEVETLDTENLNDTAMRGVGGLIVDAFAHGAVNVRRMEINAIRAQSAETENVA